MLQRCDNPKNSSYAYYGGRGIKVCRRWRTFANFLADMGEAPPGLTLERKNNDRGYTPKNCIWATRQQQANNQRQKPGQRFITHDGTTLCLRDWELLLHLAEGQLARRLYAGWTEQEAVSIGPCHRWNSPLNRRGS